MKLYRPTGLIELALVLDAELRRWPPRLPDQPIFYPVLNFPYAAEIASKWNTKSERLVGYVTEFDVDDQHANHYERRVVGAGVHEEFWVPAEALDTFNDHIVGTISVVAAYFGEGFVGLVPDIGPLEGMSADAQGDALAAARPDVIHRAVDVNRAAVFLHWLRWIDQGHDLRDSVGEAWAARYPGLQVPTRCGDAA